MGHPIPWACKLFANKDPTPPCRDKCIVKLGYKHSWTITSLNKKDQAPQPTISHLDTDHNNSTDVVLVGLCFEP